MGLLLALKGFYEADISILRQQNPKVLMPRCRVEHIRLRSLLYIIHKASHDQTACLILVVRALGRVVEIIFMNRSYKKSFRLDSKKKERQLHKIPLRMDR